MYGTNKEVAYEIGVKLDASINNKKKSVDNLAFGPKSFYKNTDVLKIIQAEYSINHCSQEVRTLLCKGSTQEKIREYCEAYVSTKGRYIPSSPNSPVEKSDKPFGLYLFIQGPNKRSVDLAISMIESIISTGDVPRSSALMNINTAAPPPCVVPQSQTQPPQVQPNIHTMPPPPAPPSLHGLMQMQVPPPTINLVEKLPIGIDRPLPGFNLPMKLIGQNGANLQYIRNETGAVVTLRGVGSAFIEPTTGQEAQELLHFSIEHSKPDGLATAREFAMNLIATVQQEYAQYASTQVQQVPLEHNVVIHQQPLEHQIMQQPVLATSITLPVVQTAGGAIMQQPSVTAVPPPQFNQPPPSQLSLPPPGVHIPQQQGPLPPPGVHIPPQQGPLAPPGVHIPPQSGPLVPPPSSQPPPTDVGAATAVQSTQQQYLITQNGQPVQGIMTSQGFVVLNQQPQQVFLSQPPGQTGPVFHQGQLAFQQNSTNISTPVSYQLQYVQTNPLMTMAGSPTAMQLHQQQQLQHQTHAVVLQPPPQVQLSNGAMQITHPQQQTQFVNVKQGEQQPQQPAVQQGAVMHVKPVQQSVQLMQPYSPSVQYLSSTGPRPEQTGQVTPKGPRMGKRKFTEEAEPSHQLKQSPQSHHLSSPQHMMQQSGQIMQIQQHSSPVLLQSHQQQGVQSHMVSPQSLQQQGMPSHMVSPQQLLQPPPHHQHYQQPQPVPHPSQTQLRQGVGMQEMMNVNLQDREGRPAMSERERERESREARDSREQRDERDEREPGEAGDGGEGDSPPPSAPSGPSSGNGQYAAPPPLGLDGSKQHHQWFDGEPKARNETSEPDGRSDYYSRRDAPRQRERQTFNHYSSKPQLYSYQPYMQSSVCPPPPPPPPAPPQQQQHYYYSRR